ncbi:lipase family alpha/beta hydrolase [Rhodococcus sp. IEGM 1330]|uniref:lipase family alpha/beta hydrolase n=1 Tax=Rhodococcus sp. IEGM 1330 TaxID=3082225 RepID=UPI002952BF74|nr:alpha/beta fold hydrolase [Rhodococcus sp. IEGM 1330]MDV8024952.1 lipase [Rhodococcus sp. IEGM 1330]
MFASLAPARRRLVFVVLALVLVGVVAAVAAVVASRLTSDSVASDSVASVDQSVPGPVLLVPGFGGSTDALEVLAAGLRENNRDATVVALPDGGVGDLTVQAQTLRDAVDAALTRTEANSVDVVGYSAGGVVARIWATDLGGAEQARRIVTLGSPHHGTQVAALAAQFVPDQCAAACQQLAPDSSVLTALNSGDETPEGPQWVSIWTELDQVVTPPSSAQLDGAIDIPVQSVCADSTVDHGNLPRDPLVAAMVSAQLDGSSTVQLAAGDCARLRG